MNQINKSFKKILDKRDYIAIYKVNLEENKSIKIDNTKIRNINISDGTYVLDRGTGWIKGNDESLVDTAIAEGGLAARINVKDVISYSATTAIGGTLEVDIKWLINTISVAVGKTITESDSLAFEFERLASEGKKLYMKAYATFKRYDTITVVNKIIEQMTIFYEPEGGWLKYIEYDPLTEIDMVEMIEFKDRCVLGDINSSISNAIDIFTDEYKRSFSLLVNSIDRTIFLTGDENDMLNKKALNEEYIRFKIMDKNDNVKLDISLNGEDRYTSEKLRPLSKFVFEEDDYLQIYSKNSNKFIKIIGEIVNSDGLIEDYSNGISEYKLRYTKFILTSNGIKSIFNPPILNTINVNDILGNNAFNIGIDKNDKVFKVFNMSNKALVPESFSNREKEYFSINILDKNNKKKFYVSLNGYDIPAAGKLNSLNNLSYDIDDRIQIYRYRLLEENKVSISGKILNSNYNYSNGISIEKLDNVIFKLTENYLAEVILNNLVSSVEFHTKEYDEISEFCGEALFKLNIKSNNTIDFVPNLPVPVTSIPDDYRDMFKIEIMDKNNQKKLTININANENVYDKKFEEFKNITFENGDLLSLSSHEIEQNIYMRALTINGYQAISNNDFSNGFTSKQLNETKFILTNDGLVELNEQDTYCTGFVNIVLSSDSTKVLEYDTNGRVFVGTYTDNNKYQSWMFICDEKYGKFKIIPKLWPGISLMTKINEYDEEVILGKENDFWEIKQFQNELNIPFFRLVKNDEFAIESTSDNKVIIRDVNKISNSQIFYLSQNYKLYSKDMESELFDFDNEIYTRLDKITTIHKGNENYIKNLVILSDVAKSIEKEKTIAFKGLIDSLQPVKFNSQLTRDNNFSIKSESINLNDGTYVRSNGVIVIRKENDSFIKSAVIPAGVIGSIEKEKTISSESTIDYSQTIGFDSKYVKATLSMVLGKGYGEEKTILAKYLNTIDVNNDIFMKTYLIEEVIETIRVKNKKIIDKAVTYNPIGTYANQFIYSPNSVVNQNILWKTNDINEKIITSYTKEILDLMTKRENKSILTGKESYMESKSYTEGTPVAFLFTVSESGRYEFKNILKSFEVKLNGDPINQYGCNTNMRLVRLVSNSDGCIAQEIFNIDSAFRNLNKYNDFNNNDVYAYEADLYSNISYALIVGPRHSLRPIVSNGIFNITYKVKILKK